MTKFVVFLQGTLGLGKSTVGNRAMLILKTLGFKAITLEQDTFVPNYGLKGAGPKCFEEFTRLLKLYDVVILQRNNADPQQYLKYVEEAKRQQFKTIFFSPSELKNAKSKILLGLICIQSVINRKNHIAMKNTSVEKQVQLVLIFLSQIRIPNTSRKIDHVIEINYLKSMIKGFQLDQQTLKWFQEYFADVCKNGWNAKIRPIHPNLRSKKYQQLRLPIESIALSISQSIVDRILEIG